MLQLRSMKHGDPAYVRFENKTGRSIDVVWVNYSGELIRYGTLRPGEFIDVNTFKNHPWICIDPKTGEKMKMGKERVFYPRSCREINARFGLNIGDFRVPVPVCLPLFTLRQISLQVILNCLGSINGIETLELPSNLQKDLQRLNQNKENLLSLYAVQ